MFALSLLNALSRLPAKGDRYGVGVAPWVIWLAFGLTGCVLPSDGSGPLTHDGQELRAAESPDCRLPGAYPFEMDPSLSAAGFGLNTNENGIQDYGELAVDCGGAGQNACTDVPLSVVIQSDQEIDLAADPWGVPAAMASQYNIRFIEGELNGRGFQLVVNRGGTPGALGDIALITEAASRRPHQHAPGEAFPLLSALSLNIAVAGGVNIAMDGVTGGHPYAFSTQEAVLASRYVREILRRERVIIMGGSYGGASALTSAALYPEHFDGVIAVAAPPNGRQYQSWLELSGMSIMASGISTSDGLYYSELDGQNMAAAQAGLRLDNLDITALGNARVEATIVVGEVDGITGPSDQLERLQDRLQRDGIDWVRIEIVDEAGHGGNGMGSAVQNALIEMYSRVRVDRAPQTPVCPRARERDTTYDEQLRALPVQTASPFASELWSQVGDVENTAPTATAASGTSVYTGSLQGYVVRRDLLGDGNSDIRWRVPVGRVVKSVAVHENTVVVGSLRGITLLDARDGTLIREVTGIGGVLNVIIADVIPAVPGLEIAARVDADQLRVSRLATGEVLSLSEIGTGGGLVMSADFGTPRLYAPLARGHVVGFEFVQNAAREWRPVARWLSDYLANDMTTLAFVRGQGGPVMVAGGRIAGGLVSQTGAANSPGRCRAALKVIDHHGALMDEIALHGCVVNRLIPWNSGEVMVGTATRSQIVNLASGQSVLWPTDTAISHGITVARGDSGRRVLSWLHDEGHQLRVYDDEGRLLQTNTLSEGTTPAMDIFRNPTTGRDELSVLTTRNITWRITRYDLLTGVQIGDAIERVFPNADGSRGTRRPNRMVRKSAAFTWASYEIFLNDGAVFAGSVRVATRCGKWYATESLEHEQLFQVGEFVASRPSCLDAWAHAPVGLTGPGNMIESERVGSAEGSPGFGRGALRFVNLTGDESHFLMTTAGGNVALFDTTAAINTPSGSEVSPVLVSELGGTTTSLAVSGEGASATAVLGSWMPASDGATVHVFNPETLDVIRSFNAGNVLAVALANVNTDEDLELLVGTADGTLKVYTLSGSLLAEWSAGDLHLGENGSLQVRQHEGYAVVAFPVTGGVRVLEVRL